MLANHTSINLLMQQIVDSFNNMYKKKAYLDSFKKEDMFKDSLSEFDDSLDVTVKVINEYKACEKKDYLQWDDEKDDDMNFDN